MGDSGSMLIGLMLSASVTSLTGQFNFTNLPAEAAFPVLLPVLLPLAVLAVPFVDLLLAVVRRTRAGRSPFSPDKMHLHHRLLEIGHTHRRAVLTIWYWAALLGFSGVAASFVRLQTVATGVAAFAVVGIAMAFIPARRRPALAAAAPAVIDLADVRARRDDAAPPPPPPGAATGD